LRAEKYDCFSPDSFQSGQNLNTSENDRQKDKVQSEVQFELRSEHFFANNIKMRQPCMSIRLVFAFKRY
jgi:outer membrane protein W